MSPDHDLSAFHNQWCITRYALQCRPIQCSGTRGCPENRNALPYFFQRKTVVCFVNFYSFGSTTYRSLRPCILSRLLSIRSCQERDRSPTWILFAALRKTKNLSSATVLVKLLSRRTPPRPHAIMCRGVGPMYTDSAVSQSRYPHFSSIRGQRKT